MHRSLHPSLTSPAYAPAPPSLPTRTRITRKSYITKAALLAMTTSQAVN